MRVIHATTKPYSDLIVKVGRRRNELGEWHDDDLQGRMASRNTETVLVTQGRSYPFRHGLGYSEPMTWVNQGQDMPRRFITEPSAYAYGLATCISANPEMSTGAEARRNRAAGIEHDVEDGDWLVFDLQYVFRIDPYRGGEYIRLEYLGLWKELYGIAAAETTNA